MKSTKNRPKNSDISILKQTITSVKFWVKLIEFELSKFGTFVEIPNKNYKKSWLGRSQMHRKMCQCMGRLVGFEVAEMWTFMEIPHKDHQKLNPLKRQKNPTTMIN